MEKKKTFVDRCAPGERPYGCDYHPFAAVDGGVTWSVLALSCRVTVVLCSDILPLSCCFLGGFQVVRTGAFIVCGVEACENSRVVVRVT